MTANTGGFFKFADYLARPANPAAIFPPIRTFIVHLSHLK